MQVRHLITTVIILLFCMQAVVRGGFRVRRRRRTPCATHSCKWHWGACSKTCGGGVRSAIKTATKGACGSCNMPIGSQRCNTHCCSKNCQWRTWGSWGSCYAACETTGIQVRERSQNAALCGGSACIGSSLEKRSCSGPCCPKNCQWRTWGSWGSCPAACETSGIQKRTRSQNAALCGGSACIGSSMETRSCSGPCCPRHCYWDNWGSWRTRSKTCGGCTQTRARSQSLAKCGGGGCSGSFVESRSCNNACCPGRYRNIGVTTTRRGGAMVENCQWRTWGSWGSCSAACESSGIQKRTRSKNAALCGGSACIGSSMETRSCSGPCCPINSPVCAQGHCYWDNWGNWRTRSKTCGGGNENCQWRTWGSWGSCSAACESSGIQKRTRSQNAALCGGSACIGSSMDTRSCSGPCCPRRCYWHNWGSWSTCSKTCGGGTQTRARSQSLAKCGGRGCSGSSVESRSCNNACCPVDCKLTTWTTWSECSQSCGAHGIRFRRRNIAQLSACGGTCNGKLKETDVCNRVCFNGGKIVGNVCQCTAGWTEECCAKDVNECENVEYDNGDETDYDYGNGLCHFDADCINTNGSYRCECMEGFKGDGKDCIDINECSLALTKIGESSSETNQDSPPACDQNANCQNVPGKYYCFCKDGFTGDGFSCKDINECDLEPCENGGTCVDLLGRFECQCSSRFTGDRCQEDVNECDVVNNAPMSDDDDEEPGNPIAICSEHSTCSNTFGGYDCKCDWGYTSDGGSVCFDLNECAMMKNSTAQLGDDIPRCHAKATCHNLEGTYNCECNPGYRGSGFECEEINECATTMCQHGGTCVDKVAGFECICPNEYNGLHCENDINECSDGTHACDRKFGKCINSNGSYSCECQNGFYGDGKNCTDIDECASELLHSCDTTGHERCQNTDGSYLCPCKEGYEERNGTCVDMDECAIGNHSCRGLDETCINTNGSYTCGCREPKVKKRGICEG